MERLASLDVPSFSINFSFVTCVEQRSTTSTYWRRSSLYVDVVDFLALPGGAMNITYKEGETSQPPNIFFGILTLLFKHDARVNKPVHK